MNRRRTSLEMMRCAVRVSVKLPGMGSSFAPFACFFERVKGTLSGLKIGLIRLTAPDMSILSMLLLYMQNRCSFGVDLPIHRQDVQMGSFAAERSIIQFIDTFATKPTNAPKRVLGFVADQQDRSRRDKNLFVYVEADLQRKIKQAWHGDFEAISGSAVEGNQMGVAVKQDEACYQVNPFMYPLNQTHNSPKKAQVRLLYTSRLSCFTPVSTPS